MEKITAVIVYNNILGWEAEAVKRIAAYSKKIIVLRLPDPGARSFSLPLGLLFKAESKMMGSSMRSIQSIDAGTGIGQSANSYSLCKADDIFTLIETQALVLDAIISFVGQSVDFLHNLSDQFNVPVYQLQAGGLGPVTELHNAVIKGYKKNAGVIPVNIYKFYKGEKQKVYETYCGIEHGLLLKSINSCLFKCSLLFERVLMNKDNVGNLLVSEGLFIPVKGRRNPLYSFLSLLFDKIYYKRQWILLYDFIEKPSILSLNRLKKILPPKNKFWADPFVVKHDDEQYIFFEELEFSSYKGYLSYSKISPQGKFSVPQKIIEQEYHLSFPNVFKIEDRFYMIPETSTANNIQLWSCNSFPDKWEHHITLIADIKAVDTIVHKIAGKWWLFCTVKPTDDVAGHEELCIYSADELFTDKWTAHPKNPVISDARAGRNAGQLVEENGRYFRIGQYSGDTYGKAITRSEILHLSDTDYQEKLLEVVFPDEKMGFYNLHTFNNNSGLLAGDALRRIRRFF